MRRQMARRVDAPKRSSWPVALAAIAAVLVVGLGGAMFVFGGDKAEPAGSSLSPSAVASGGIASASNVPTDSPARSALPSSSPGGSQTPTTAPSTPPGANATPKASDGPATNAPANAAPMSAVDFDLEAEAIAIEFPLRADTAYHYRDNWYERRTGAPDPYNHAKPGADGQLMRLHDGIDIYAPENEPVLAPFDGVVIDPASKWQPWEPDRYGLTVVVESDEPTSRGYTAVLVHLDRVWVDIGQHVSRGQVIGVLGRTGNAENVEPQLHFELRAPFAIDWSSLGENRMVDAFNPYPSLRESDPAP
jgi:murein DD-endopeptidase MepM/ murein hydrolase activator NlpD